MRVEVGLCRDRLLKSSYIVLFLFYRSVRGTETILWFYSRSTVLFLFYGSVPVQSFCFCSLSAPLWFLVFLVSPSGHHRLCISNVTQTSLTSCHFPVKLANSIWIGARAVAVVTSAGECIAQGPLHSVGLGGFFYWWMLGAAQYNQFCLIETNTV